MPPPPVTGAALGSGLADGLGVAEADADADAVRVTVGVTVGVPEGDTDLLADGLALAVAEALAVLLDEAVAVGEVGPAGENEEDGAAEGLDAEQADTATEASMVMLLQPITANLALSPVPGVHVRTFMEPPHASRQVGARSLVPASETDIGRESAE